MTTIIASTNRQGSNTLKLANYYQKKLAEHNYSADILSLTDLPDSLISNDLYGQRSHEFQQIQDKVLATSKFIFIIPEYNGSFPGVLKAFIDACKFPDSFFGKKAVLTGLSSGKYGNVRGIEHFTGICHYIGMHVLPMRLHIPNIKAEFDAGGDLTGEETIRFVEQQLAQAIDF